MPGCSALNCSNRSPRFRLFQFPRDPERRQKWLENSRQDGWQPTNGSRLCEVHFEFSQYELLRADGWRKLKPNAVPTLFDIPETPGKLNETKSSHKITFTNQDVPTTSRSSKVSSLDQDCTHHRVPCEHIEELAELYAKNEILNRELTEMEATAEGNLRGRKRLKPSRNLPSEENECAVASCQNSWKRNRRNRRADLIFHRFPSIPEVRHEWAVRCHRVGDWNPVASRICSEHFDLEDYVSDAKRRVLKTTAVPSLKLPKTEKQKKMSITKKSPCGSVYVFSWVESM